MGPQPLALTRFTTAGWRGVPVQWGGGMEPWGPIRAASRSFHSRGAHAFRSTWTRRRRTCTAHDHQAHRDVTVSRVPRTQHGNARSRGVPVGHSGAQHSNTLLDRCDMAVTGVCGAPAAGSGTPRTGCCGESVRSHHWFSLTLPRAPQLHHKGVHDDPGSERQIEPATQPVRGPAIHSHTHTHRGASRGGHDATSWELEQECVRIACEALSA